MTSLNEIYKCEICGNIIEMVHTGVGHPVCCGQPMTPQDEKKEDVGAEKHVPTIQITPKGIFIKVGSVPHPMDPDHFIEWIEIISGAGEVDRRYLSPGEAPEAIFQLDTTEITARAYCNIHGLWKS
jgi:superoxide reductase